MVVVDFILDGLVLLLFLLFFIYNFNSFIVSFLFDMCLSSLGELLLHVCSIRSSFTHIRYTFII